LLCGLESYDDQITQSQLVKIQDLLNGSSSFILRPLNRCEKTIVININLFIKEFLLVKCIQQIEVFLEAKMENVNSADVMEPIEDARVAATETAANKISGIVTAVINIARDSVNTQWLARARNSNSFYLLW